MSAHDHHRAASEAELVNRATDDQFYAMYPERRGYGLDPRDPADHRLIAVWNNLHRMTALRAQTLSLAGDPHVAHVGGVWPFFLGLPLGGLAGYFLRRWQEANPGQALPGIPPGTFTTPRTAPPSRAFDLGLLPPTKTSGAYVGSPWLARRGSGHGEHHHHRHPPDQLAAPDPWASTTAATPEQADAWANTAPSSPSQLSPEQLLYQQADLLFWRDNNNYKFGRRLDPADPADAAMIQAWQQSYASVVAAHATQTPNVGGPWLDIDYIGGPWLDIEQPMVGGPWLDEQPMVGGPWLDIEQPMVGGPWLDIEQPMVGGPWLDIEQPMVGGPWLDIEQPMVGGPWLDIEQPMVGGPWLDIEPSVGASYAAPDPYHHVESDADRRRRWPQTRALIESAKREVVDRNASSPAVAWVWALDASISPDGQLAGYPAGYSTVTPFSSYAQALDYMRSRNQTPHVALAIFDTQNRWPNPVGWTKSNDPAYEAVVAERVSQAPRMAGDYGYRTTIGAAIDDVRGKAEALAARRAGNVIGVIHTSKDGAWHVLAFRAADDADDWINTATLDPATYTYAAYFNKEDPSWPRAYVEKISGMRAPPGAELPRRAALTSGWHRRRHGWNA